MENRKSKVQGLKRKEHNEHTRTQYQDSQVAYFDSVDIT